MFSGYLTSYCCFTFADFVFLPKYLLAPPHTAASVRTGQNTGNNPTRVPFHKIVMKTGKNWESLPASASCSMHYTHKHIQSWWNKQQHCRCSTPEVPHTLGTCALTCAFPQKGCAHLQGGSLCLLSPLSLVLSNGISVTGTWEG